MVQSLPPPPPLRPIPGSEIRRPPTKTTPCPPTPPRPPPRPHPPPPPPPPPPPAPPPDCRHPPPPPLSTPPPCRRPLRHTRKATAQRGKGRWIGYRHFSRHLPCDYRRPPHRRLEGIRKGGPAGMGGNRPVLQPLHSDEDRRPPGLVVSPLLYSHRQLRDRDHPQHRHRQRLRKRHRLRHRPCVPRHYLLADPRLRRSPLPGSPPAG